MAKSMAGTMPKEMIAAALNTSLSNLKRGCRGVSFNYHNYCKAKPDLVRQVNKFYERHTKAETATHFGFSEKQVDHMVYRYKSHRPKQIRWSDEQVIEAARMAGLVSPLAQAKYFNRPNAHIGSIKSLWMKKFKIGGGSVNGMANWMAKEIVTDKAPRLKPKGLSNKNKLIEFRNLVLWVDMEKHIRSDVPEFISDAIKTMANFQRWLHASPNPRPKILKMIKEREL